MRTSGRLNANKGQAGCSPPRRNEDARQTGLPCKIKATAHCLGHSSPAAVLDLSPHGLRIYLRADISAGVGSQVTVETEELGSLSGEVRWIRFPYLGMALARSSNTDCKDRIVFQVPR